MRVGLIDYDSKIPNLALMKLSTYHKSLGNKVILNPKPGQADHVYCSVLFTWSKGKASKLVRQFPSIEFGGTGWDLETRLPDAIEQMRPDYDLYTIDDLYPRLKGIRHGERRMAKIRELLDGGIGFTSRGCVRDCPFCFIPQKEGPLTKASDIESLLNSRSNLLTLLDNNFTADPECLQKLHEMRDRNLTVNITQGLDVRLMTDEIAQALSHVRLYGSGRRIYYAWDLMGFEKQVWEGINILKRHIKTYRHTCYMLVGFNTTWEEDFYRFSKLKEAGVTPYVMIYNKNAGPVDLRLMHFARWVNAHIHKACRNFSQYERWAKVKEAYLAGDLLAV